MFDIGFSELLVILVIGLVVLGPKRLPVAIRTVMSWVNTVRGMAANVQNELTQELKLQELQESIKKAEKLKVADLSPELSQTVAELKQSAEKMQADLQQQVKSTEAAFSAPMTEKVDAPKDQALSDSHRKNASTENEEKAVEAEQETQTSPSDVPTEQKDESESQETYVPTSWKVEPFNATPAVNIPLPPDDVEEERAEIQINPDYFPSDDLADTEDSTLNTPKQQDKK